MAKHSKSATSVKRTLDTSADELDATTLAKLRRIRHDALTFSGQSTRPPRRWWIPVGAIGTTVVAALVATWMTTAVAPQAHVDGIEDIDLLASADNTDLYEQMDFYEWLESQQGNKQSDAG